MQNQVVAPDVHGFGTEFFRRFFAPLSRVLHRSRVGQVLVTARRGLDDVGACLKVAEVGLHRGRGEREPAPNHRLRGEGAFRVRVVLLFLHEKHVAVHELHAVHLHRLGIGANEKVGLLLDRHGKGIDRVRGDVPAVWRRRRQRETHAVGGGQGVCPGDRECFLCGGDHAGLRQVARSPEAPRPIHEHTDANTECVGVHDVHDLLLASDDEVVAVASDACIGKGGTTHLGGVQGFDEELLRCGIHRRQFADGDDSLCECFSARERRRSQRQCASGRAGFQEVTPVRHGWLGKGIAEAPGYHGSTYDCTSEVFRCT